MIELLGPLTFVLKSRCCCFICWCIIICRIVVLPLQALLLQPNIMPTFEDALCNVAAPTAEEEARVRRNCPEAFAGEADPPAAEELEPNEFRYDEDGTHHRQLSARERTTMNEGHL